MTSADADHVRLDLRMRSQRFSSVPGRSQGHVPRMCPRSLVDRAQRPLARERQVPPPER